MSGELQGPIDLDLVIDDYGDLVPAPVLFARMFGDDERPTKPARDADHLMLELERSVLLWEMRSPEWIDLGGES